MSNDDFDQEMEEKEENGYRQWYEIESDEKNKDISDIKEYDITASPNDFNVKTINDFITSGVVKIPGFQRHYVWDKIRASKLIESIIIGLPIPQIFLYEESKNKFLVIDGQQRLMSIYYFIKQRFPKKEKRSQLRTIFEQHNKIPDNILHNDEYFNKFNLRLPSKLPGQPNRFNGMNYATLGDYKTQFDLRTIRNVIIKQNLPKDDDDSSIFEIFNRLNSGGINLGTQEIRGSLYHSPFYDLLYKINNNITWRTFLGLSDPDLHMKDIEFLLRGFAMLISGKNYRPSMTKFLNDFSKNMKTSLDPEGIEYFERLFNSFMDACNELPKESFYSKNRKFSITIFEAVFSVICSEPLEKKELVKLQVSLDNLERLKSDPDFIEASQKETASLNNVNKRKDKAQELLL